MSLNAHSIDFKTSENIAQIKAAPSSNSQIETKTLEVASKRLKSLQSQLTPSLKYGVAPKETVHKEEKVDPWYKNIRSLISQDILMSAINDEFSENASKNFSKLLKELVDSGAQTSTFIHQIFKEDQSKVRMGMPGVAIVAAYIKEKHQLKQLICL